LATWSAGGESRCQLAPESARFPGEINFSAGQSVAWVPLPLFSVQTITTNWLLTLHDAQGGEISRRLATSRLRFPPLIAEGPTNRAVTYGLPLNLRAAVFGPGPWTYQWQRNGTNVPAATNSWLHVQSVTTEDSGYYLMIAQSASQVFQGPHSMLAQGQESFDQ
jgi:hypothetical protein